MATRDYPKPEAHGNQESQSTVAVLPAMEYSQLLTALTEAVRKLTEAVTDQKIALTEVVNGHKEAVTLAVDKVTQAVTPTPPLDRFRGTRAEDAVKTFNDIIADLNFVPFAAGTLKATASSSSQIDLDWTEPNRKPEGFKIERRDGSSQTFIQIAEVKPDVRSYSDIGLSGKTIYYYRVRAFNLAGDLPYTTEAAGTTH